MPVSTKDVILGAAIRLAGGLGLFASDFTDPARVVWYGVPVFAIVAGLMSLHGLMRLGPPCLWIGDISYSIYLCQAFVTAGAMYVVTRFALPPVAAIVFRIAAALVAATLPYRLFEVPSTRLLSRLFAVRNPQPAAREA